MTACVKEDPATIEFASAEYNLLVGEKMDFMKEVVISNTDSKPVFAVSDKELASISPEGMLTALKDGKVKVNAELEGLFASCDVIIGKILADTVIINAPKSLAVDSVRSVTVTVKPESYDKENLKWDFSVSDPSLKYEATKENAGEYKVKFTNFVSGGKLIIAVSDSLSGKSHTSEIEVVESGIPATKMELVGVDRQTETLTTTVKLLVEPADYDTKHLDWIFEPTSEDIGFTQTRVSDVEYNVSFASYVRGGSVTIIATDRLSSTFAQKTIEVLAMPEGGLTELQLSPEELTLFTGDEPYELDLISEPEAYDPLLLVWTSSDEKVATVKDGVITPVGEGKATITVKDTVSEKEASCALTVAEAADGDVRRIELSHVNLTMKVGGESMQLVAACYDAEGNEVPNYANLEWSAAEAENENGKYQVVEVSQRGVVTPKQDGTTVITVVNKQLTSVKAICNVTVVAGEIKVKEVKLSPESKCIAPGKTFQIEATVLPEEAENKTLIYSSADSEIATVSETGLVTAIKKGATYIRVTSANGVYGECEVIVDDAWVDFGTDRVTLVKGEERVLNATVLPENIEGGTMTWSSSAPEVVSVTQDGKVAGLSAGEAEIKVETSKGIVGALKVVVINDFAIFFSIKDDITSKGIHQFESFEIGVGYTNDYMPESMLWEISDPSAITITKKDDKYVAEVIYDGIIPKDGSYPVTITHKAGKQEKSQTIQILKAVPKQVVLTAVPEVNGEPYKMLHGDTFKFEAKVLPEQASQQVSLQGGGYLSVPDNTYKATTVGVQYFTAYASGHTEARCDFSIEVLPVKLVDMVLSNTVVNLQVGALAAIGVTFVPENASYKNLSWSSSDESVARVDVNGVITAVSSGTAVVTATQENNGISRTCNVTVLESTSADVSVGDYYYSDGTTSSTLDASKTVIGVVFSVNNPTQMGDAALSADHPDCTHGYVVSTVEYSGQDWGSVSAYNGHANYNNIGYDANLLVDKDKANGYGNSLAHRDLNTSKPEYAQMFNALDGIIATHAGKEAAPESSSSWYVPSYREMALLNAERETVNASLVAAGGTALAEPYESEDSWDDSRSSDWYWTSTIYGVWYESGRTYDHFKYAYDLSRDGWTTSSQATAKCKVRIILAF